MTLLTFFTRKHVFRDLHPYICTFKDCIMPDRLFTSRNEWFSHELQLHRRSWLCLQGCLQTFRDTGDFVSHVRNSHRHMFIEDQLPSLIDMSESTAPMDEEVTCSVCNEQVPHLKQLRRHLGRHQEQLALFALPLSVNEDENKRDDLKDSDYGSDNTVPVPEPDFLRQTLTHTPEAQDNAQNNEDGGYNRALLQEALEWLDVTEDQPDDFVIERYIKKVSPKERRTMKVGPFSIFPTPSLGPLDRFLVDQFIFQVTHPRWFPPCNRCLYSIGKRFPRARCGYN